MGIRLDDLDRGRHLERVLVDHEREVAGHDRAFVAHAERDGVAESAVDRRRRIVDLDDAGGTVVAGERRVRTRSGGHLRAAGERRSQCGDEERDVGRRASHG